ncbi:hypothetical protein F5X98DRAFT_336715 [Xylaria grammica]|nr:hypothetical protein F5X98DRAFT_336715 [Xylaria grammica]
MPWSTVSAQGGAVKHGYTAPSWPWASVDAEIVYGLVSGKEFENRIINIDVLTVSITTAIGDPQGRVLAAALQIKGLMSYIAF